MTERDFQAMIYIAEELFDIIDFHTIIEEEEWDKWMERCSTGFDQIMDRKIEKLFSEE